MPWIRWTLLVLLLGLAGAASWLVLNQANLTRSSLQDTASPELTKPQNAPPKTRESGAAAVSSRAIESQAATRQQFPPPTPRELARAVAYAPVEQALRIIERGIRAGVPAAYDARQALLRRCGMQLRGLMAESFDPDLGNRAWYLEKIRERCSGLESLIRNAEFIHKKAREFGQSSITRARITELAATDPTEAARYIENTLARSADPYEIFSLLTSTILLGGVYSHLRVTHDLFQSPNPELTRAAFYHAIEVLRCRRGDMCGSNSRMTLDVCLVYGHCHPGTTYLDFLKLITPAIVKSGARRILERLDAMAEGKWPTPDFVASGDNEPAPLLSSLFINDPALACAQRILSNPETGPTALFQTFRPDFRIGHDYSIAEPVKLYQRSESSDLCKSGQRYRRCFLAHASILRWSTFAIFPPSRGSVRPIEVTYPNGGTETFRLLGPVLRHDPARYLVPVQGTRRCSGQSTNGQPP